MSVMEYMPDDILLHIFSFLNRESLCLGARMTNSRWRRLTYDSSLWRHVTIPNHFTDRRLRLLLVHISEFVEEIEATNCNCLTPEGFQSICNLNFASLKKLAVPIATLIPQEVYLNLSKCCPRLQEIENIRTAYNGHCNPLECQQDLVNLTVVHDRPVATFGRLPITQSALSKKKREKWALSLSDLSSSCLHVKSYRCNRGLEYLDDHGLSFISRTFPLINSLELHTCNITDDGLRQFLEANQLEGGLCELIFDKPGPITDMGLELIAARCPALTHLKLTRCSQIRNKGIQNLVQKCPNITDIHISNVPGVFDNIDIDTVTKEEITNDSLFEIGRHLKKLTFFRIFHSKLIDYSGIAKVVSGCPHLQGIMIFQCEQICDKSLDEILRCRFLRNLILVKCDGVTPEGVINLILLARCLNRLTFYTTSPAFCSDMSDLAEKTYDRIDSESETFRPNQIRKLALRGVGGGFLQLLTVLCPNTVTVDMRDSKYVSQTSMISVLRNCELLQYLDISSMADASDEFLRAIVELAKNLRVLTLGTAVDAMTSDALVDVIKSCESLNTIEMDLKPDHISDVVLVDAVKRYHGGLCTLYVEDEEDVDRDDSRENRNYTELHFTPIKYLGSIKTKASQQSGAI